MRRMPIPVLIPLMALAGCAAPGFVPKPTAKHLEYANTHDGSATLSSLRVGRTLFLRRCGTCHDLHVPEKIPVAAWPGLVERKAADAKLTKAQIRTLSQYLSAVAGAAQDTASAP